MADLIRHTVKGASIDEFKIDGRVVAAVAGRGNDLPNFSTYYCPACSARTDVIESRASDSFGPFMSRRLRRCPDCQIRFLTFEVNAEALYQLVRARRHGKSAKIAEHLRRLADTIDGLDEA